MASSAQVRFLTDIALMVTWEAPTDEEVEHWNSLTSATAAVEIRAGWRDVERVDDDLLALLREDVVDELSDPSRSYLRKRLGFLPPRNVVEVVTEAAPVHALAMVSTVRSAPLPPPAAPRISTDERAELIEELRQAHRAARGRDLTVEEAEMHERHDVQVIRDDIAGLRYNTPPAGWSRPVRFFGGIVDDETLALIVDVATLARGHAPDPDRYAQYMSYRQPDARRAIATFTEKLRLDGIAPNAACCTEVYESLSPRARAWADAGGIPENLTEAK